MISKSYPIFVPIMQIREATEKDIPAIIQLLKESLGESMIPKSENLWRWKHLDNPFGKSPTLLAVENGNLIGVRAFLKWEFIHDGKIYNACRAVDTATHPDFQGKGIFKALTTELIEEIKKDGVDFIYNTPNKQSTPGYLKMGWKKRGKLPLKLQFHFNSGKNNHPLNPASWDGISDLVELIETLNNSSDGTHLKKGYLKWRYLDCPLFPYYFLSDSKSYLLFYRIKEGKLGREIRICDFFTLEGFNSKTKPDLHEKLSNVQKLSNARFTSFSGLKLEQDLGLNLGSLPILNAGPLVTLREVKEEFNPLSMGWNWSLGDLELF